MSCLLTCVRISHGTLCSFFFFSSRRRHTRWTGDWSSDVCSSDLSAVMSNIPHRRLPEVVLNDGTRVPALGLGTWHMGEKRASAAREAAALRAGDRKSVV